MIFLKVHCIPEAFPIVFLFSVYPKTFNQNSINFKMSELRKVRLSNLYQTFHPNFENNKKYFPNRSVFKFPLGIASENEKMAMAVFNELFQMWEGIQIWQKTSTTEERGKCYTVYTMFLTSEMCM